MPTLARIKRDDGYDDMAMRKSSSAVNPVIQAISNVILKHNIELFTIIQISTVSN
jgi:hypothetical protein